MKWNIKSVKMNGIFRENMRIIILLSSIVIVSAGSVTPSPRSVNVALETSFLFEPKDINDNILFIKNIKLFLDKLYKILAPQARPVQTQQFRTQPDRRFSFFDFMKNLGQNIMNFTQTKIEDVVEVLHVEVKNIAEKSKSTFNDIIPNKRFRAYVQHSVKHLAKTNAQTLKEKVRKMMDEDNPVLASFARKMNNYYDDAEVKKMHKLFRKLNRYLENRMDSSKVMKEFLKVVLVDKYKSLNDTTKTNLMKDIDGLSEYLTANKKFKFKIQGNNNPRVVKRKDPPVLELIIGNKAKAKDEGSNETKEHDDPFPFIPKELKKSIGKNLKITAVKVNDDEKKKKAVATNEIIVDNVELIVQSLKKP